VIPLFGVSSALQAPKGVKVLSRFIDWTSKENRLTSNLFQHPLECCTLSMRKVLSRYTGTVQAGAHTNGDRHRDFFSISNHSFIVIVV
jgi:hypothetical protein